MTGGACQADGSQMGMGQNAFTNMLDSIMNSEALAK
jgi:hypothetical protein